MTTLEQELEQSRDVLDWIAGLLRQPYAGTLNAIAEAVKGTGRDVVSAAGTVNGPGTRPGGSAARFTLDEKQAAAWLERATRQADGVSALDGQDHDDSLPDISGGWCPSHDGHSGTVSELLHIARAAGIITCPPGWEVAYEYASDVDGDGYRWLLVSGDERRPVILADAFNDAFPSSTGAEAALDLLREAVTAGNELLGDLDRCAATRTMSPAPPSEVWILEYQHKHGTDLTAHATEEAARLAAAQIARDFWEDVASWHPEMPATPDGLSDEDATRIYFANFDAEDYHIHGLDVTGADVAPLQARAPEIAELVALLPRGEWGADELMALANWLTSHGYDLGEVFNEDFKDDEEPGGYEGFVRRADSSVISVQCSEGRCRQCPDDTGPPKGHLEAARLQGYYCEHGCGLCGTGGA